MYGGKSCLLLLPILRWLGFQQHTVSAVVHFNTVPSVHARSGCAQTARTPGVHRGCLIGPWDVHRGWAHGALPNRLVDVTHRLEDTFWVQPEQKLNTITCLVFDWLQCHPWRIWNYKLMKLKILQEIILNIKLFVFEIYKYVYYIPLNLTLHANAEYETYRQDTRNDTQTYLCSSTSGSDIWISFLMVPSISAAKESCYTHSTNTPLARGIKAQVYAFSNICAFIYQSIVVIQHAKLQNVHLFVVRQRHCIRTTILWKYHVKQYAVQ